MSEDAGRRTRPRRRILDAALQLALQGGYDALQVRALSERAGVSSRTIYANFPSLDSLLILAIAEQSEGLYARFTQSPPANGAAAKRTSPATRVNQLISELTQTMTANRPLTVALLRALLSGKPDVSQYIKGFGDVLQAMLASAIAPDAPTVRDREVAELLENVWFTALVGWATGTTTDDHIAETMQKATRLLLPEKESLIS
jgi:TetR/AcrR family transcriptional regulator, cholesterol catabolism regulator